MMKKHCGKKLIIDPDGPFIDQDKESPDYSRAYHIWHCQVCKRIFVQRTRVNPKKSIK